MGEEGWCGEGEKELKYGRRISKGGMKDDFSQKEECIISYLSRGDQYASQRIQSYERFLTNMLPASRLKVEQGKRGANKL